jgi:hypothetical protein
MPTPIPVTFSVSSSYTATYTNPSTANVTPLVCWDIRLENVDMANHHFVPLLSKKNVNGVWYEGGELDNYRLLPGEKRRRVYCDSPSIPEIAEITLEIQERAWANHGYVAEHLLNPQLWTKYSVDDRTIKVNSQPAIVELWYPDIPTDSSAYPVWNIVNLSNKEVEVEIIVEYRYLDNDEVKSVIKKSSIIKPLFGTTIGALMESSMQYRSQGPPTSDHPSNQYYNKFIGIWYKVIP